MVVLNKIYTKTGDAGETALGNGARVAKPSMRVNAYGTVDEVNSTVGLARLQAEGDVDAALAIVVRLTELGIKLAIDDFGTGYSSLNYLRRFPINTVKIDRSFVMELPQNKDDLAITRAVIAMAHQLKMAVVAEGVETVEQMNFLLEQNCEYAQGYLFSKALPIEDVVTLINSTQANSKLA